MYVVWYGISSRPRWHGSIAVPPHHCAVKPDCARSLAETEPSGTEAIRSQPAFYCSCLEKASSSLSVCGDVGRVYWGPTRLMLTLRPQREGGGPLTAAALLLHRARQTQFDPAPGSPAFLDPLSALATTNYCWVWPVSGPALPSRPRRKGETA